MKRMIDNKKLREIEASGGTQWYKHNVNFTGAYGSSSAITFLSLRQDTLKDGVWNPGNYPIILTSFDGASGPNVSTSFPSLFVPTPGEFYIYYFGNNNEITSFTLDKTSIKSEEVTAL